MGKTKDEALATIDDLISIGNQMDLDEAVTIDGKYYSKYKESWYKDYTATIKDTKFTITKHRANDGSFWIYIKKEGKMFALTLWISMNKINRKDAILSFDERRNIKTE